MNIPEEAIEAAAEGVLEAAFGQELPEAPIDLARAAMEAALPHLEAALRKQIAADIRELLTRGTPKTPRNLAVEHAARIVEGNTK